MSSDHVMSETFKQSLRVFHQLVRDARVEVVPDTAAEHWKQQRLNNRLRFVADVERNRPSDHTLLVGALTGGALAYGWGEMYWHAGVETILASAATVGLAVGYWVVRKHRLQKQVMGSEDDISLLLTTLQPLRGSNHCADVLRDVVQLCEQGLVPQCVVRSLIERAQNLIEVLEHDRRRQRTLQSNQELLQSLSEPLTVDVVVETHTSQPVPPSHLSL